MCRDFLLFKYVPKFMRNYEKFKYILCEENAIKSLNTHQTQMTCSSQPLFTPTLTEIIQQRWWNRTVSLHQPCKAETPQYKMFLFKNPSSSEMYEYQQQNVVTTACK